MTQKAWPLGSRGSVATLLRMYFRRKTIASRQRFDSISNMFQECLCHASSQTRAYDHNQSFGGIVKLFADKGFRRRSWGGVVMALKQDRNRCAPPADRESFHRVLAASWADGGSRPGCSDTSIDGASHWVSSSERATLIWLAEWEPEVVRTIAAVITRAHATTPVASRGRG
jgi:hypothetical protein